MVDRPHLDPLPQERKQLSSDFEILNYGPANVDAGCVVRLRKIPLLRGEKAGMREDITENQHSRLRTDDTTQIAFRVAGQAACSLQWTP